MAARTSFWERSTGYLARRTRNACPERGAGYCAGIPECATRRCLAQLIVVTSRGNESDVMQEESPELPLSTRCSLSCRGEADVRGIRLAAKPGRSGKRSKTAVTTAATVPTDRPSMCCFPLPRTLSSGTAGVRHRHQLRALVPAFDDHSEDEADSRLVVLVFDFART